MKTLIAACGLCALFVTSAFATDRIGETGREFRDYCQGADRMRMCGDIIVAVYGVLLYGPTRALGKAGDSAQAAGCVPDDVTMDDIVITVIGSLRASSDAELLGNDLPVAISDILFLRYPCN